MRVLSLFSGAGGADLALEACGYEVAAFCDIEPHARAVLRYHWPKVAQFGDVATLEGLRYAQTIDLVVGGSPCQDLSIAGRRAGLTEGSGTRSSLFFDQVRIWDECRAPYLIWENVHGALSSNAGEDFAAVLSSLVGSAITVPANGWKRGGVAAGREGVAAWRVLDLQYFGVPQRRKRVVVLAARAGGIDPAEVLALSESVREYPPPRFSAREDAPLAIAGSLGTRGNQRPDDTDGMTFEPDVAHTLGTPGGGANDQARVTFVIGARQRSPRVAAVAMRGRADGAELELLDVGISHALRAPGGGSSLAGVAIENLGVRMLTPRECERIMGWPDDWTRWGVDAKGRLYELKDTPRYRLCGNGIGREWMEWVGMRLLEAVEGKLA